MSKRAVVVGGGIGGLGAAVGLHRIGWRVDVLERAPAFAEIGAGIALWPNAVKALRVLGLADQIAALTEPQRSGGVRTSSGRWLNRWEGSEIQARLGDPMIAIHRARLHRTLLEALPADSLHTGVNVTTLEDVPPADLIVAADGIDSVIRKQLWPDLPAPRYSGATAWRGICESQGEIEFAVTWGKGAEAGILPLEDGRVYWYLSLVHPEGTKYADEKAFVQQILRDWHDPFPRLIAATPAEAVLRHDIYHLATPLPSYVSGHVALLGDAAHAMTPNLGQGACQALEDAAVLMVAMGKHDLSFYDSQRRPRSQSIAKASYRTGQFMTNLTNPLAVALRNTFTRLAPKSVSFKGMAGVADWTPPV